MNGRTHAAAATLLVLTACSSTPTAPGPATGRPAGPPGTTAASTAAPATALPPTRGVPAVELPRPAAVDRQIPDAVAYAALTALYSHDTAVDHGPGDAARRALPWLSAGFARTVRTAPPTAPPGATWSTWSRHHAVITPQLAAGHDDRPTDTAASAHRQYTVERQPRGRDGWRGQPNRNVVFVLLTRDQEGWSVAEVNSR